MKILRKGYTLVELLVVISIIVVLMGLLLPAIHRVRESARVAECQGNLKNMSLALMNFHDNYGCFPPGLGCLNDQMVQKPNSPREARHPYPYEPRLRFASWPTWILPFIEYGAMFDRMPQSDYFDGIEPGLTNTTFFAEKDSPKIFSCPSEPRSKLNYSGTFTAFVNRPNFWYAGVAGTSMPNWLDFSAPHRADGILYWRSRTKIDQILDGTSNTAIIGEHPPDPSLYWGWWHSFYYVYNDPNTIYTEAWEGDVCMGVAQEVALDYANFNGYAGGSSCGFVSKGGINLDPTVPSQINYKAIYKNPGPPATEGNVGSIANYCDHNRFWSNHPNGCLWAFADGSVKMISYNVNGYIISAIGTKSGSMFIQEALVDISIIQ